MAQLPIVIKLSADQRALIREASGKNVAQLGIEPVDTGSGWLYSAGGEKFWLLRHPESYVAAAQTTQPCIDPRHASFRLKIGESPIHRWEVCAEERIPARRNVSEYSGSWSIQSKRTGGRRDERRSTPSGLTNSGALTGRWGVAALSSATTVATRTCAGEVGDRVMCQSILIACSRVRFSVVRLCEGS